MRHRIFPMTPLVAVILAALPGPSLPAQSIAPGNGFLMNVTPLPYAPVFQATDRIAVAQQPEELFGQVQLAAFEQEVTFPQEPAEEKFLTLDELRAEMKKLAWTKGDFRIVPYGILWFNMAYETERTNDGDYVLYVFSRDQRGYDAFHVNARATRLGIDVSGPQIPLFDCADSGGKVEIDFFGQFAGGENKPGVLLRHAYWEVKNEQFRLLAGQTWDVISPLYPGTLMYSVGWGGGNIGYRRAQLRYERYVPLTWASMLTWQTALAVDLCSELAPANCADHAGWPVIQTRVAVTLGNDQTTWLPITVGVSGHIGEQQFLFNPADDTDDEIARTWSLNADVRVPVTERFGFQGEFFTGENLGTYMGGIVQGINVGTGDPIRTTGGWFEVWYDWTSRWHSHVGYGIDDPVNRDVANGGRTYNHFIFANLSYDVTEKFLLGFEYTSWRTLYQALAPGESDHFAFVAKYGF